MSVMKAYKISRNGDIDIHGGPEDFWMDEEVEYGEIESPTFPGHSIYYNDNSMWDPGEVRVFVGGVEVPLPVWFVGIDGEGTKSPEISPEELRKTIKFPS